MSHHALQTFILSLTIFATLTPNAYTQEESESSKARLQQRSGVIELQSTIVGNQEQPEVIYIVPWQQIDAPAPSYQPMQQVIDGQFEPLDRDEWRRKIDLNKVLDQRELQN